MNAPSSVRPPPASGTRKKQRKAPKAKASVEPKATAVLSPVAKAPAWQPIDTDFLTDQIASIIEAVQVQLALVSKACEAGPLSEAEARGVAVILTRLGDELDENHIAESIERLANTGRPPMNLELAANAVGAPRGLVDLLSATWREKCREDHQVVVWKAILSAHLADWSELEASIATEVASLAQGEARRAA